MSAGAWVVTGAASGIGRACAEAFVERAPRGFPAESRAVLVDLDATALEAAAESLGEVGRGALRIAGDLCEPATVDRIREAVAGEGGLVALVHAAGLSGAASDAAAILEVNLAATSRLLAALEPELREGAAGVVLASQAGHFVAASCTPEVDALLDEAERDDLHAALVRAGGGLAESPSGAYGLSKRGVHRLVVRRAAAWGAKGARLVSVSPGPIDTPMGRREVDANRDSIAVLFEKTPVGQRLGRAEEIADVVAFLCSPGAAFVSGCDWLIDGGSTNQILGPR